MLRCALLAKFVTVTLVRNISRRNFEKPSAVFMEKVQVISDANDFEEQKIHSIGGRCVVLGPGCSHLGLSTF